jgi:hypothetical protein
MPAFGSAKPSEPPDPGDPNDPSFPKGHKGLGFISAVENSAAADFGAPPVKTAS